MVAAVGCLWLSAGAAQAQVWPDLIVTEIEISPTNPAPGQNISVTVHAMNIGNAIPTAETFMYLYHDTPSPIECDFDQGEPLGIAFPPETERLFNFTVSYPAAGSYELWAWVDACENLIDEGGLAGETNNALNRVINVGLGDLTIDSIAPTVADPVPGQPVFVNVTVRNTGPAILEQIWYLRVYRQQEEPMNCLSEQAVGPFQGFPPNGVVTHEFGPFTYEVGGEYPIWAWIDCEDNVMENDDGNNKLLGTIAISRPNLVVESITPSVATPNANAPFNVDVTVRNVGSAPAGPFRVSVDPDRTAAPSDPCALASFQEVAGGLAVNAATTLQFNVTYTDARQHSFWAVADSCNAVNEAVENDNSTGVYINVGSPAGGVPDLVVERVDVSEISTPEYGGVNVFDVTVRNVGPAPAGPFWVGDFAPANFPGNFPGGVVFIGSPGPNNGGRAVVSVGPLWNDCNWRSREVPNGLAPGATVTVQFWRHFYETGAYTFTAYADACGSNATYQTVFESSETNNGLTIEFEAVGCDADSDGDGICDEDDFCPNTPDPLNNDSDGDGIGDVCDDDDDNDGVLDVDDCEPRNPFIYPGNVENCTDGIDNNCDGMIDEGAVEWFRDVDGDGFGVAGDIVMDCAQPEGYAGRAGDCDDDNAAVYPGANGPCDDGLDNDCDGTVDNELPIWGRDADADGFTDPNDQIIDDDGVCDGQPEGYILASATPDPDDDDFMNPEPVRAEPASVAFSVPRDTTPDSQTLTLVRNGPQPYTYGITVEYGRSSAGLVVVEPWLSLDAPSGSAAEGRAEIRLDAEPQPFLDTWPATLHVSINGQAAFDVDVSLEIRNPRLTIRHTGQGGGRVFVGDAFDFYPFEGEGEVLAIDTGQELFESQLSFENGALVTVAAITEGDCSNLIGLFRADGTPLMIEDEYKTDADGNVILNENGSPDPEASGPGVATMSLARIQMDGDQEVTVDYALSGLACTACAFMLLFVSLVGMSRTGKGL